MWKAGFDHFVECLRTERDLLGFVCGEDVFDGHDQGDLVGFRVLGLFAAEALRVVADCGRGSGGAGGGVRGGGAEGFAWWRGGVEVCKALEDWSEVSYSLCCHDATESAVSAVDTGEYGIVGAVRVVP